jgi:hypothetical protein
MITWLIVGGLAAIVFLLSRLSTQVNQLQRSLEAIQKGQEQLSKGSGGELLKPSLDRILWKLGFDESEYEAGLRKKAEEAAEAAFKLVASDGEDGAPAAFIAYVTVAGLGSSEDAQAFAESLKEQKQ